MPILIALTAALVCPAEHAHYALRHDPSVTAAFRAVPAYDDWPAGVALGVRIARTGKSYWWLPWNGGTDGRQNIASTTDVTVEGWRPPDPDGGPRPEGDRGWLGTDADFNVIDDIPRRGVAAPAHFLILEAGSSHDAVFGAKQFFDLVRCDDH